MAESQKASNNGCCYESASTPRACTPATCMDLPAGITCGDCINSDYCAKLVGTTPARTYCDWFPRRFQAKSLPVVP